MLSEIKQILHPLLQVFHLVLRILSVQADDAAVNLIFRHKNKLPLRITLAKVVYFVSP